MNQDLKRTRWAAADWLRSLKDAAECKHVAHGRIFVKCICDAFDERRAQFLAAFEDEGGGSNDILDRCFGRTRLERGTHEQFEEAAT